MKYIVDHDLHIHSKLSFCSGDPEQTKENILKYAEKRGLKHICITDHFWDSELIPLWNGETWYGDQNYSYISSIILELNTSSSELPVVVSSSSEEKLISL